MNKICLGFSISMLISANVFATTDLILPPDSIIPNACVAANTGVYENSFSMVPVWEDAVYVCNPGYYLPKDNEGCVQCPENSYCAGGAFRYDTEIDQGVMECPNSWYAPMGMSSAAQCGRILHIGDSVVYLRSEKKTTPSLNVRVGDDVFYGNMTVSDVPMNTGTERKLKLRFDDTTWSVYDDTVDVTE